MNHKRRRPKHQRAGCLLCKPHKDERTAKEPSRPALASEDLIADGLRSYWLQDTCPARLDSEAEENARGLMFARRQSAYEAGLSADARLRLDVMRLVSRQSFFRICPECGQVASEFYACAHRLGDPEPDKWRCPDGHVFDGGMSEV